MSLDKCLAMTIKLWFERLIVTDMGEGKATVLGKVIDALDVVLNSLLGALQFGWAISESARLAKGILRLFGVQVL